MLIKHLLKKPLPVAAYTVLMVALPGVSVRLTYQTAMLIEYTRKMDANPFKMALIQVFGYFVLWTLLNYWLALVKKYMISSARVSVKNEMFHHMTNMSRKNFGTKSCGEHIASFSNDISLLEYRYFTAILDGIDAVVSFVAYFAAILTLNRVFALIVLVCETLGFLICFILKKKNVTLSTHYIDRLGTFTQKVREFFAARTSIHNYSAVRSVERNFRTMNQRTEESKTDMEIAVAFTDAFAHFTRCMGAYTIVAAGAVLMTNGAVTFSEIYIAYSFANSLSAPVKKIIQDVNDIYSVRAVKTKIEQLIAKSTEEKARDASEEAFSGITLRNVFVQFNGKMAVSNINYHFEPGKKYLIVGRNGCGKSTLMKLLVRDNEQYTGSVVLCGKEIRDLPYSVIQAHVSYISEGVSLLTDTVQNNISLYRSVSPEQLAQVVSITGLRIPLERCLHDGGKNISSGEKRRIEIARCLINQPDVMIFDEATSTLDILTAYEIEKMMLALKDKTVIFVSHNFSGSLMRMYDTIILMDNGRIIASGSHDQLSSECRAYRELIELKCGR